MYAQAIALAVSAAIGAAGAWTWQANSYSRQISDLKTEYATAQVRAVEIANADTLRIQAQASKAAAAAATRLQRLAADRDRLRVATDGLRDQLATTRRDLPTASCPSVRDYATASTDVFQQCATALERLAGQADGHASDSLMLQDAWPKLPDRR